MTPHIVSRPELLQALELAEPALSPRDVLEQSASFVFKAGWVATFDKEVYIRTRCAMPAEFTGAVQGNPLLEALRKLPDPDVELSWDDEELCVAGVADKVFVRMNPTILLPVSKVEKPPGDGWEPVPRELFEGIKLVAEVCAKDESGTDFRNACVNFTPEYVEGTDGHNFARFAVATGLGERTLTYAKSAKTAAKIEPTEANATPNWLHFRSGSGLAVSIRRYPNDYWDTAEVENLEGEPFQLPKALEVAIPLADTFSSEYSDDNKITVELARNRLRVTGVGVTGRHVHEPPKVAYAGPEVAFSIGPETLLQLVKTQPEVEIAEVDVLGERATRLVVRSGAFYYVAECGKPQLNGRPKKAKETEQR